MPNRYINSNLALVKNQRMKTKINISITILILSMLGLTAQGNEQLIASTLGQDANLTASFINGMIKTDLSLNCDPWDDDAPCTDLCDPWDDDAPCPNTAVMKAKIAASPQMQEAIIKKTMIHFEEAIASGKGGKVLTPKLLGQMKKKYPGKKLKTLKARFRAYLKHLKSLK